MTASINEKQEEITVPVRGIGRLAFIGGLLGIQVIQFVLAMFLDPMNNTIGYYFQLSLGLCLFGVLVFFRIQSMGFHPALMLLFLVPVINLWCLAGCLCNPPDYAETRKLDAPALIVLWLLGIILVVGTSVVVMLSYSR